MAVGKWVSSGNAMTGIGREWNADLSRVALKRVLRVEVCRRELGARARVTLVWELAFEGKGVAPTTVKGLARVLEVFGSSSDLWLSQEVAPPYRNTAEKLRCSEL